MRRRALGPAILGLLLLAAPAALRAQGLASPGPLTTAHAKLDDLARCLDCHDAGRELSGRKCLACHVSLAREIRADQGYHAVATKHGAELGCRTCHSEHNGRPYQMVKWPAGGKTRFDHAQTGWALTGAHARERCEDCHKATLITLASVKSDASLSAARTYLGLGTSCAACHLDEHRGRVSQQCQDCHTVDAWKPAPRFDHARTHFRLTGLHATVTCDKCHSVREELASGPGATTDSSFLDFHPTRPGWATGCIGCHPSPHKEAERVGSCEKCHVTAGWFVLAASERRFDHTTVGFALNGAHAAARCESCHLATARAPLPPRVALVRANFVRPMAKLKMVFDRCDACHADVHQGELSPAAAAKDCAACHTEARFAPTRYSPAAHDSTRFPLTGAHLAVACNVCHADKVFAGKSTACVSCHLTDYNATTSPQHQAAQFPTDCATCHTTVTWSGATFNHDGPYFPIYSGTHQGKWTACTDCHLNPADFSTFTCIACHAHSNQTQVDGDHKSVKNYTYDSNACYQCHRNGNAG